MLCWLDITQLSITEYPLVLFAERVLAFSTMLYCSDITQWSIAKYPLMSSLIGVDGERREPKKTGVTFDISLDDVLKFSALRQKEAARALGVSKSTGKRVCRKHGIQRWRDLNKEEVIASVLPNVGDNVYLDSLEELELDATLNGSHDVRLDLCWPSGSFIGAECSNLDATCSEEGTITKQKRKKEKTGVRIEISLEEILKFSNMKRDDAARELDVSSSTLKRICRDFGIHQWPPLKVDKVGAPWPSDVEHWDGIPQLTSDMPSNQTPLREEGISQLARPSNQVFDSVAHAKPRGTAVQDMKMVMIKAKSANGLTIKFQLPLCPRLKLLHQEVDKRLNLKAEAYDIFYEDEDGELILMVCDKDLQLCINTYRSLGKNVIVVLLQPKKLM